MKREIEEEFYRLFNVSAKNGGFIPNEGDANEGDIDIFEVWKWIEEKLVKERQRTLEEVRNELEQIELNIMPSSTLYTDKDVMISLYEIRQILSKLKSN